jgi:small subunit ribosomal protein S20
MANTQNAKKAHRASLKKRIFNLRRKKTVHDTLKKVSEKTLPELYQALDKAAKHGTISKNKAARMKSRITKRVAAAAK